MTDEVDIFGDLGADETFAEFAGFEEEQEVQKAQDEQTAKDDLEKEQKFGKFKNPQELLKAYGELEKEFTRKSQRLKELEKLVSEKSEEEKGATENPPAKTSDSGQAQPEKSEENWKEAVDKFFKKIPSAKAYARDIAEVIVQNPELKDDADCLSVAFMRVLSDKFKTPEQLMNDGQFLEEYVLSSDRVRNAVIDEYISGVRKNAPPATLKSGGLQCVAPKDKPKTIEDAGRLFLKNNK